MSGPDPLDRMIDTWLLANGSYDDRKAMAALLENSQGWASLVIKVMNLRI